MHRQLSMSLEDLPTAEILDKFGSDPRNPSFHRSQRLQYDNGEMHIRDNPPIVDHFPKPHSLIPGCKKGELLHELDADVGGRQLHFTVYAQDKGNEGLGLDRTAQRVRLLRLFYHLDSDTLSLYEPPQDNSGCMQGRIFRSQRVPRPSRVGAPFLHWSELRLGVDVDLFGTKYRLARCDNYTRRFLEGHGVAVGEEERIPDDPWLVSRRWREQEPRPEAQKSFVNQPPLMFFRLAWLDQATDFFRCRQRRLFKMTVFCGDHTVCLHEETEGFEGQLFLRRIRLPKVITHDGVLRHYRSWDFRPGIWIDVFARNMFIVGCASEETRRYIEQQFGGESADIEIDWKQLADGPPPVDYLFTPQKITFICEMESPPPTLSGMQFIMAYDINKRTVDVSECSKFRKWSVGRHFLTAVETTLGENQFHVGACISLFRWRFKLTEAEFRTAEYLKFKRGREDGK
ncbi:hypothetical protein PMAYCL1PPCAC_00024 [Pristionchus mayeri]|uniref:DM10 domain-containing protein n=1 Tax=Pristionchus mayeri TaxID=1317129 RepID=A0AAN4YY26_9BILA|nr:hypothetical protein PMAYCL1PPCAC_00024 [Pristionchus mayeri]